MWREVMSAIHGPEWQVELRALNRDVAKAGGSDGARQLSGESAGQPGGGQRGAGLPDGVQQEDGEDEAPATEAVPERQSTAGVSRSVASDGPPRALELRERLNARIDLSRETAAVFTARMLRIAGSLDVLDDPVGSIDLAEILARGELTAQLAALAPDSQITFLKNALADVMADDGINEEER